MQYKQFDSTFYIYVEQNEPVMATLIKFCQDHGIQNGQLSGIGAVKEIEIGAYDVESQTYVKKTIPGTRELVSFQGNIALKDGIPFIHAHITISNHDLELMGGHLFEMSVAAVGEFVLHKLEGDAWRELDPKIGLATWCLEN
ncbi:MAG: DUF296 domain-containing protein [FCB group bacterium]|nr:DUF296 domain-containing protein [FCB group bacterium]